MTRRESQHGFTLIEVIATLIIMALAGAVAFTFLQGAVSQSYEPVLMAKDLGSAMDPMEDIRAEYQEYRKGNITWNEFKTGLGAYPVSVSDKTLAMGNPGFNIVMVTLNTGQQCLCALYSQ